MSPKPDAFDMVVEMLRQSPTEQSRFPPTELFSEGWMLRLLLHSAYDGTGGMPFELAAGATWYSEALLASAFAPRQRGDEFGEGTTHADGVIGHIEFRPGTNAGLALSPTATQFVVTEAKMASKLAPGTTKVRWFDQGVRNIAAMAWAIHKSSVPVEQLNSLGFWVFAPTYRIEEEATFNEYLTIDSINSKINRRINLYTDDRAAIERLEGFRTETLTALLGRIEVGLVSWETLLESVEPGLQEPLMDFYQSCLQFNASPWERTH